MSHDTGTNGSSPRAGTRSVVQPALAHVRLRHAGRVMLSGGDIVNQRHRLRIPAPRTHLSQPLTVADSLERPPVRQMHGHAIDRNSPKQHPNSRAFFAERTVVLAAAPDHSPSYRVAIPAA
jgi:hypothetical protein